MVVPTPVSTPVTSVISTPATTPTTTTPVVDVVVDVDVVVVEVVVVPVITVPVAAVTPVIAIATVGPVAIAGAIAAIPATISETGTTTIASTRTCRTSLPATIVETGTIATSDVATTRTITVGAREISATNAWAVAPLISADSRQIPTLAGAVPPATNPRTVTASDIPGQRCCSSTRTIGASATQSRPVATATWQRSPTPQAGAIAPLARKVSTTKAGPITDLTRQISATQTRPVIPADISRQSRCPTTGTVVATTAQTGPVRTSHSAGCRAGHPSCPGTVDRRDASASQAGTLHAPTGRTTHVRHPPPCGTARGHRRTSCRHRWACSGHGRTRGHRRTSHSATTTRTETATATASSTEASTASTAGKALTGTE